MADPEVLYEPFRNYTHLIETLASRKNNKVMRNEHSSNRKDDKWFGTRDYNHAVEMLSSGYMEVVKELKTNVENQNKINSKYMASVPHAIPHNAVVGYIPNVPAALQNLPQSMINVNKKPLKRKTLHILYGVSGSAAEEREYFEKAGAALLSAVNIIELSGIQTKIDMAFFLSETLTQFPLPTVCIKNYGERFSIQKVSFPLVHTSMFRRIGFKWLETYPGITDPRFARGYGSPPSISDSEKAAAKVLQPNEKFISTAWINNVDCSVEEILKKLEVL